MKLFSTSLLTALGLLAATSAQAQGIGVHVGPKAGLALSTLSGQINAKSFYKNGYSAGLMMRCRSSKAFAIQPELLYVQQGSSNGLTPGSSKPDYDVNLNYFQLPIMLKVYLGGIVNLQFGPSVGLLLSARRVGTVGSSSSGAAVSADENVKSSYYDLDGAVCGGLGLDLPNGLVASARLNYGLLDISTEKDAQLRSALGAGGLHNRGFEFAIGYLFGAAKNKE
ncbi:porin family protein [Hymenobacter saemangeumensis]|uniref:Porin family protein n=1 Tax=Hymenobacter saemangeumensis TaxID=1084522 RepID=A0ABP8IT43_9BACT